MLAPCYICFAPSSYNSPRHYHRIFDFIRLRGAILRHPARAVHRPRSNTHYRFYIDYFSMMFTHLRRMLATLGCAAHMLPHRAVKWRSHSPLAPPSASLPLAAFIFASKALAFVIIVYSLSMLREIDDGITLCCFRIFTSGRAHGFRHEAAFSCFRCYQGLKCCKSYQFRHADITAGVQCKSQSPPQRAFTLMPFIDICSAILTSWPLHSSFDADAFIVIIDECFTVWFSSDFDDAP